MIKYFAQAYDRIKYVLPRGSPRLRQLHIPDIYYIVFYQIIEINDDFFREN